MVEGRERSQSKTEPSTASTVSPSQSRESRFDGDAVGETVHEIENRIRRLGATFDRERSKQQDFFAWGYSHFFDEGLARDPVIVFF